MLSGRAWGIGSRDCWPLSGEKLPTSLTSAPGGGVYSEGSQSAKDMGIVGFCVYT